MSNCEPLFTTNKPTFNNNLATIENTNAENRQASNETQVVESIYPKGCF